MNNYGEESWQCSFHPREVIVGICALCLKERLLELASKQSHLANTKDTRKFPRVPHRKHSTTIPKVFSLGSFLLQRLEFRQRKSDDPDNDMYPSGGEDSFISIKFENNGRASWDNSKSPKHSWETLNFSCNHSLNKETNGVKSVVEHTKPRGTLRWRKRIGHLFQVVKWKRSNKANSCHVGSKQVEGINGKKSWIRTLTKRRTME